MKVAIVCDWLTNVGGAEKVLLKVHQMYPDAPIYTSQYDPKGIDWFKDADVRTGWLQRFPASLRRYLGWFRARYFASLDLSAYDVVISVTGAEAKAVRCINPKTGKQALHISYCHVPTQYYWQMYDDYVKNPGFGVLNPLVRFFFRLLVGPLRRRDFAAADSVDQFVTISDYAKHMIKKYYHKDAIVVHPPVEVEAFLSAKTALGKAPARGQTSTSNKPASDQTTTIDLPFPSGDYFVTTSRQVTWKRLDLAVRSCLKLDRPLLVVGEGPEHKNLVKMASGSPCIKFLPLLRREELAIVLANAKGYIFPSLEPFGIAPVEALATGCPVIAFCEGGAKDYVADGKNGALFDRQTVQSLVSGIQRFETLKFDKQKISRSAENFSEERFVRELNAVIADVVKTHDELAEAHDESTKTRLKPTGRKGIK